MKIVIIAAGSATRLGNYTVNFPKGMLKINDKSILDFQLELFKKEQLNDITIITGPHKEQFNFKGVSYINDVNYQNHDVLGSLMVADSILSGEVLTSYSDIIFDENILKSMLEFKGDIGIAVDLDWAIRYVGRSQHPKSEADNVLIEADKIIKIKKNIMEYSKNQILGEFIGLMKLSKKGSKIFVEKYRELKKSHIGRFRDSPSLEKAYLTDMIQELIDSEIKVNPVIIKGKWCEIDTPQDLEIAKKLFH